MESNPISMFLVVCLVFYSAVKLIKSILDYEEERHRISEETWKDLVDDYQYDNWYEFH